MARRVGLAMFDPAVTTLGVTLISAGATLGGVAVAQSQQTHRERALIVRTMYLQVSPRVEYALTPLGQTLGALVCALCDWAADHYGEIEAARSAYDTQQQGTDER